MDCCNMIRHMLGDPLPSTKILLLIINWLIMMTVILDTRTTLLSVRVII